MINTPNRVQKASKKQTTKYKLHQPFSMALAHRPKDHGMFIHSLFTNHFLIIQVVQAAMQAAAVAEAEENAQKASKKLFNDYVDECETLLKLTREIQQS